MLSPTKILIFFLLSTTILNCSTTQEGRQQILLFDNSQLASMGTDAFNEVKQKEKPSQDMRKKAYLDCIAKPIIRALNQDNHPENWEIQLFTSSQANAFALPGKKVGVYDGLFAYAVNQHQVAAVIGHELAHVTAQHGNERISRGALSEMGLSILGLQGNLAANLVLQYGVLLPYGRTQESEADLIGLSYMAKAGFDPRESVALWQNMSRAGSKVPEFLSTHPSSESRIKHLSERIPQVLPYYQQAVAQSRNPDCQKYLIK